MKKLLNMNGIITVLNIPFTTDNSIDLESLQKNVNVAIKADVAGFLVPAMASEVEKLTKKERIEILRCVIDTVDNRVPIIGGTSAKTQEERITYAENAINLGCDGLLISIPYGDSSEYIKAVKEICKVNPKFMMLQDWDFSGYGIPVEIICQLFDEIDIFRCLKIEVVPAGRKYSEVLKATGGKLHVSGGWAVSQMIEALDRGAHAFMPTGMHELYTTIYRFYKDGKRDKAQELFEKMLPILAFSNQHLDISIHFFKQLLYRQGTYSTPAVRQPILPFDEHHQKIADELVERAIKLIEETKTLSS